MSRFLAVVLVALTVRAGADLLRKPLPMDDVIGDNYYVKYNQKTDALELMRGTHPEKAAKVAEYQAKRAEEEKEKSERAAKLQETKAHEEATKTFWTKKLAEMKEHIKTATDGSKKAAFALGEKTKVMEARKEARAHEMKTLKETLEKAEQALEMAMDTRKKASADKANADQALNSNTNPNQKGALKVKADAAANDVNKAKVVVDAAEEEVKKAKNAIEEKESEHKKAEKKDAAELAVEQTADKKAVDAAAEETATEKQVTDRLVEEMAKNPNGLNGKIVMLRSRSLNMKKNPYLSSCPNEAGQFSWLWYPIPEYGWRVVYDRESDLKSGETTVYLERWCNHKKRPRPEYLQSNMLTGAGYSYGTSMEDAFGWKLNFGEDARHGGHGEELSLSAEKEYISDKPHCNWVHIEKVALYGNKPHDEGRYFRIRGKGEDASWGGVTKEGDGFEWDLVVLKDPSNKDADDKCEGIDDKSVPQGGGCIADRQCQGPGKKHGLCRKCGKCQYSLRDVNPCEGSATDASVKVGGDMRVGQKKGPPKP